MTPIRLEAPTGGFEPEFQAIFEENLGFPRRVVPPVPPRYWGGGGGGGGASRGGAPMPASPIQRMMQIGIAGFVFLLLGGIGLYVAWIVYTSMPH